MTKTIKEAEEAVETHQEETTHSEIDVALVSTFPKLAVVHCHDCGQQIALVTKE